MIEIQPLNAEAEFRKWAESFGWRVTKKGWPDFICRRGNEIIAVEVKWSDWLSEEQEETLLDLHAAGIATYVWTMASGGLDAYPDEVSVSPRSMRDEEMLHLRREVARLRQSCDEAEARMREAQEEARSVNARYLEALRIAARAHRDALSDIRYLLRATERRRRAPSARLDAIRHRVAPIRAGIGAGDEAESTQSSEAGA